MKKEISAALQAGGVIQAANECVQAQAFTPLALAAALIVIVGIYMARPA